MHVERHLQSSTNRSVWAAGDSADTAGMPLTPVAVSEAKVAASNMLNGTTTPDYTGIPTRRLHRPRAGARRPVRSRGQRPGARRRDRYSDTSNWYSSYRIGGSTDAAKILIDRASDRVVGAHLLGPECGELATTLGVAIKLGLTTRRLRSATAAYPTLGSDLGSLL
ncbi:NAD(P)/FAD-dependent oxidoreductase [Dermatophilaceae bacterium Soc4.6]